MLFRGNKRFYEFCFIASICVTSIAVKDMIKEKMRSRKKQKQKEKEK